MGFDIKGSLSLDGSAFDAGLTRAGAKADKFAARAGFAVKAAFAGAMLAVPAIAVQQSKAALDYAGTIADLSAATGAGAGNLQKFDYALALTGASLEDGAKAMRMLALARDEALKNPEGDKAQAFANFGIDAATLKNTTDPSELMLKLGDAVKGTNLDLNSMPKILELIGSKSLAVLPALVAGLREMGEVAQAAGAVMSDETIAKLDAAGDAMTRLGKIVRSNFGGALASATDLLESLLDKLKLFGTWRDGAIREMIDIGKNPKSIFEFKTNATRVLNAADGKAAVVQKEIDDRDRTEKRAAAARRASLVSLDAAEAKGVKDSRTAKGAAQTARQLGELDRLNRAEELRGMDPGAVVAKVKGELDALNAEQDAQKFSTVEQALAIAQKIAELEQAKAAVVKAPEIRALEFQNDSLARIGGFAANSGSGMTALQERIARATELTAENTAKRGMGGRFPGL